MGWEPLSLVRVASVNLKPALEPTLNVVTCLISDDRVDIFQKDVGTLIGEAPIIFLERYLEVRGIGIIDVVSMFGIGSYRNLRKSDLL